MRLERRYEAEAAHRLIVGVPEGHQCRRPHGHRYVITVTLIGDVNPEVGMLMEYAEVDRRVWEVLDFVDHRDLNHLGAGMDRVLREPNLAAQVIGNPTVENLAAWFVAELKHHFPRENFRVGPGTFLSPQVYAVRIEEDSRSAVEAS